MKTQWYACIDKLADTDDAQFRMPKGRMPNVVREFLADHPDIPPLALVCPEHTQWFTVIDEFAPHQWEMCRCKGCGRKK